MCISFFSSFQFGFILDGATRWHQTEMISCTECVLPSPALLNLFSIKLQSGLRHSPSLHLYSSDRTWKHCSQNYPHSHRESVCTVITHTGSVQCCLLLHAVPVLLLCCIAFHVNCLCVLLVLAYLSFASVCLCCYDCM